MQPDRQTPFERVGRIEARRHRIQSGLAADDAERHEDDEQTAGVIISCEG